MPCTADTETDDRECPRALFAEVQKGATANASHEHAVR